MRDSVFGTINMEGSDAALDLPLKVLVWANGDWTQINYTAPAELAARYNLGDELAGRLSAVDAVTDAVIHGG